MYVSEDEEKTVFHTCKSRACPSCGYRATQLWQRDQWADLPDIPYAGIVLTMPDALWQIFRKNRHLLHDLPVLGAAVIQQWAKVQYGVRVLIMVFPHTFGRRLNFNPHLHLLASSVGLSAVRQSRNRGNVLRQESLDAHVALCGHHLSPRRTHERASPF